MERFHSIQRFRDTVFSEWSALNNVKDYLSEAGLAILEALKEVYYYTRFYDTLKDISEDESFLNLINIPDKHPEYYKTLRRINRVIEYNISIDNNEE